MTQSLSLNVIADFETQLAVKISVGATTGTLVSATDSDGVALPTGVYFLTLDKNNSKKEFIKCTLTGTALTNIQSVSRQGALTTGCAREHRVGANVIISDFASLSKMNDLLSGVTNFDSATPLRYDGTATISNDAHFTTKKYVDDNTVGISGDETVAGVKTFSSSPIVPTPTTDFQASTKKYADDLAIAGSPDASTTVKGIVEEATQDEIYSYTDVGSTGARLFVNPDKLSISLVAGEAITANDALMISNGTESKIVNAEATVNSSDQIVLNAIWLYQSFTTGSETTSIDSVTLNLSSQADQYVLRLRATPTGADIATANADVGVVSKVNVSFTFSSNTVTPSTTYYLVLSAGSLNPGNPGHFWHGGTTSSYSGGVSGRSTDTGANWTTPASVVTGDFYFRVFEKCLTAGRVYKASANIGTEYTRGSANWVNNFIGFAVASVSALANVKISSWNILKGFSGLVAGSIYYISNTAGGISSSAGISSKKVGIAIESDKLLIKNDN